MGVATLVRAGELRCRRDFEDDDWAPAQVAQLAPPHQDDVLVSERPAPYRPQRLPVFYPRALDNEDHAPGD